jgi:hypothetical protein
MFSGFQVFRFSGFHVDGFSDLQSFDVQIFMLSSLAAGLSHWSVCCLAGFVIGMHVLIWFS